LDPLRSLGIVIEADELAEVAKGLAVSQGVVPKKPSGRVGERIAAVVGIAAREAAERAKSRNNRA